VTALFDSARRLILAVLKVPAEPRPPAGSPGSLRVFRAGENYRRLLFWGWVLKEVLIVVGFLFWFVIAPRFIPEEINVGNRQKGETRIVQTGEYRHWLTLLELAGFTIGAVQMPFTYALMRLKYEQRWYMVTDRGLRIREGIAAVKEMTLSFANIQQITVRQNPFQRLFGLSNVEVKSAGGGGVALGQHSGGTAESWHTAVFRHVSNAEEIRDLIVARQRALKEAGLGDPDDVQHPVQAPVHGHSAHAAAPTGDDTLDAARSLLGELRELRRALGDRAEG